MLTTNLEPVYGIILAYFIIGGKEKWAFYGSRNYHHYSNLKSKHKAGKKIWQLRMIPSWWIRYKFD
jgi:hypothetical protein